MWPNTNAKWKNSRRRIILSSAYYGRYYVLVINSHAKKLSAEKDDFRKYKRKKISTRLLFLDYALLTSSCIFLSSQHEYFMHMKWSTEAGKHY